MKSSFSKWSQVILLVTSYWVSFNLNTQAIVLQTLQVSRILFRLVNLRISGLIFLHSAYHLECTFKSGLLASNLKLLFLCIFRHVQLVWLFIIVIYFIISTPQSPPLHVTFSLPLHCVALREKWDNVSPDTMQYYWDGVTMRKN